MFFNKSEKNFWVEKFKKVFLEQDLNSLGNIFDIENFGIHNGLSLLEYCEYEFREFKDKSENFGLTLDAEIACFELGHNMFYFSLGKKEDKALFEAIFGWNMQSKKAVGNGYFGKIEPKMQFVKKNNVEQKIRRVNIKPATNIEIKKILLSNIPEEDNFEAVRLKEILGGNFYYYSYNLLNDDNFTYWEELKLYTNKGIVKHNVLMRGEDHPLFIKNLYPKMLNKKEFTIEESIYPVIIYVLKEDGQEEYFKYPKEKNFIFDRNIKKVCLTDTLSFDWIIEL
jgi:hypothetical protein